MTATGLMIPADDTVGWSAAADGCMAPSLGLELHKRPSKTVVVAAAAVADG